MLNIIIFHHFDYPVGMATTKRFQYFADYIYAEGNSVTLILKTHKINTLNIEEGFHNGIKFYKVFFKNERKYPFHYDRRQNIDTVNLINNHFDNSKRNIILTGGITPETYLIIRKLLPKWELYCDYVEDYTTISSIYSVLRNEHFLKFIKTKIAAFIFCLLEKYSEDFMFRKAKGISAISPYLYSKAKKRAKNVISIPITANRLLVKPTPIDKKTKTLFFAGTGSLKDGLDIIAKAFSTISLRYDVVLKISGKITQDGEDIINRNCKNLSKVQLLGFLSDADYYSELAQADIMLMTRNNTKFSNAGFPFKLGEYLATGKPLITTRVSGIDQYLGHKESALFIEPGNAKELELALSFLLDNPEIASSIGLEGQKVFEEHFLAEKNCKKLFDFINNQK